MEVISSNEKNVTDVQVLYELLVYKDWKLDPEQWKPITHYTLIEDDNPYSWWWNLLRIRKFISKIPWPEEDLARAAVCLLPWQISLSHNGKRVAVLQDNVLEIRASRDEYTTIIGRATLPRDRRPQFRKISWSPDSHMIAVASSDGSVRVYDYGGSLIFKIPLIAPETNTKKLITGLEFIRSREKKTEWELLIIYANGSLDCYIISSIDKCLFSHHSVLSESGISCSAFSQEYGILFVAMKPLNVLSFEGCALSVGLTAWRLLNVAPYYKKVFPTVDELSIVQTHKKIWRLFTLFTTQDCISKIVLSPSNEYLATLHTNGTVLIWLSPILRIYSKVDKLDTKQQKVVVMLSDETSTSDHVIDIAWRRDNKLIVGWRNGTISIHDINSSIVLTYFGPEILNGLPRLTSASSLHGFLVLECETVSFIRPSLSPDISSDEDKSILDTTSELIQSTMYLLTDLEKYEPKMKSVKIVQRIFRLLGVKMTTPEELFERYLQNNEFDKAFEICDDYGLDIMKVYQRQWRTCEVCDYTLHEYLNNVQDEEWILTECLDRIPETLLGAKLLIEYSLNFTDRKSYLDELKKSNESMFKKFIFARHKFLDYAAKFEVYKQIIDENSYSMTHYEKFRRQNIVDSAIDFARSGNSSAIELLFTYHGKETLPYWLNILDNFPESVNPMDYKSLLPECDGDGVLVKWKSINSGEISDWSREEFFSESQELYSLPQKRFDEIYHCDSEGLSNWYKKRALTLERLSTIIDNAVKLLELGIDRNIKELEETLHELKMLCSLVYELNLDINFDDLQKQNTLQKLQLFIQKPDDFQVNMVKYVHPALDHYADKYSDNWFHLYRGFLLNNSKKILRQVLKYIKYILYDNLHLIGSHERVVSVLVDSIYAYEPLDLLPETENLIDDTREWLSTLSQKVILKKENFFISLSMLKKEIRSAYILSSHHYGRPLSYLNEIKENFEKSKLFIEEFMNTVLKSLKRSIDVWVAFLNDLLYLQENCFLCLPKQYFYEIFISHMLKSSSVTLIESSSGILCCSRSDPETFLSFETSVRIVISSSQYYFNSSSHFDDKFMQLAKTCLLLIKDENEQIKEELDLIFAMQLLSEIGVNILPIQVRQTKERIKLIDICFDRNSHIYRDPHMIMKLAIKLHILHTNRTRCYDVITLRLGQEAFKRNDHRMCALFCSDLVLRRFGESWKLCMNLGGCNNYKNIPNKLKLITFATIFAPARVLPHLFKIREKLKGEQMIIDLCKSLDNCIKYNIFQQNISFKWNALLDLISVNKKQEILPTIIELWTDLLSDESDFQIPPSDFLFAFPNVYSSIHPHSHRSYNFSNGTSDITSRESIKFSVVDLFLKLVIINYDMMNYRIKELLEKALTNCGILSSKKDSALSMCYFLCMVVFSENFAMKSCFKETNLLFEIELYFIALKDLCLYSKHVFSATPVETISTFIQKPFKEANFNYFKMLLMSLTNYNQAIQVKSLGWGIDTIRFKNDEQYKKDTIFGLAMTEDYENLKLAIDLAQQNNISVCEVVVSHLISLLINSSSAALTERICNEEIVSILQECKEFCIERLVAVLSTLNTTNYQILINFFSLIKILKDDYCVWLLTPKEHISLLKKLKSLTKVIDYKDLLLSNDELYFTLQPLMNSENVLFVGKFIKSLPAVIKNKYEIGKFFCQWAIEEFNKKCITASFKQSVKNFENLGKFFSKLSEKELQTFFESTILSLSTASIMDSGLRKQLVVSLMDWCHSNNTRNQYEGLLPFLQRNLDILNQLWDEDYELWNQHLKNYVFLLEQNLRDSNDEEVIMDVIKNAVLNPSVTKNDIIYLHKVASLQEAIMPLITKLLKSSNTAVLDGWVMEFDDNGGKMQFADNVENKTLADVGGKTSIVKDSFRSSCDWNDYWMGKIFNTFQEDFSHEDLKKNLKNNHTCSLFLPDLIQKISNFDQIVVLHKYLQDLPDTVKCHKKDFGISLLKLLANFGCDFKYTVARDIISSYEIQIKEITGVLNNDILSSDKLFISWLCFHSDSPELHTVGRNVIEKQGNKIDERFFQLPSAVVSKIIPFMVGTNFYQRLITKPFEHNEKLEIIKNCVSSLQDKCMTIEATTLSLLINKTPKGLKSFSTGLTYSSLHS